MTVASIPCRACQIMPWLFALYAAASLLHFMHNAEYLAQYPNLPAWWTRADVCLAWCFITTLGFLGYMLYRGEHRRAGLILLAIYGGLGIDGLLHYTRASIAHHSVAMNLTIWGEVAAAAVLLIDVAGVATWHIRLNTKTAA
jgi:hypothetical protein